MQLSARVRFRAFYHRKALWGILPLRPFQPKKYMGAGFEIARLDPGFERNLSQVTAPYSLKVDGSIEVINRRYNDKSQQEQTTKGTEKAACTVDEARLKVSFFWHILQPI